MPSLPNPTKSFFHEEPLDDVLETIEFETGLAIHLDTPSLHEIGISGDSSVFCDNEGLSLRHTLEAILHRIDPELTWMIHNEQLWITTREAEAEHLITRVYDVADLVLTNPPTLSLAESVSGWRLWGGASDAGYIYDADYDNLIDNITSTIDDDTWLDAGGEGTITEHEADGIATLVISQTRQVHEKIDRLLADLRKMRLVELPRRSTQMPPYQGGFGSSGFSGGAGAGFNGGGFGSGINADAL